MSEQSNSREDKRLPASERKLAKARTDGQVARSRDFGHVLIMGCTFTTLVAMGDFMQSRAVLLVSRGMTFDAGAGETSGGMLVQLGALSLLGLELVYPVALVGMIAAIFAAVVPGGLVLTPKPLQPKWERMSPLSGIKRIVSRGHLADSAKIAGIVGLLTVIGGWYVKGSFQDFTHLIRLPLPTAMSQAPDLIVYGAAWLILLLVLAAFIDVPMQFFRHRTELKMTFQEARQEQKETDGDPHQKAQRRQRQRDIGSARMMARVPAADVVINNPTHYSVALSYQNGDLQAPIVIAKGADHIALRIRAIAMESGVPQIVAPPLARALFAHVPVDREIPAALYSAVAQVLAFVFNLSESESAQAATKPAELSLDIPADLDPSGVA